MKLVEVEKLGDTYVAKLVTVIKVCEKTGSDARCAMAKAEVITRQRATSARCVCFKSSPETKIISRNLRS